MKRPLAIALLLAAGALAGPLALPAAATDYPVTNVGNAGPGSLRDAIDDANAHAGSDSISFNIPGTGVHKIAPISALPAISGSVTIDGYTQPGSSINTSASSNNAVLRIELSGESLTGTQDGLSIAAGNCVVRGLVVNRFGGTNIGQSGGSLAVEGNFVGTDATGTIARGGANGVSIAFSGPGGNTIGGTTPATRNVISGNTLSGIALSDAHGAVVRGNFIGTKKGGLATLGNGPYGVEVADTTGAVIGGTSPGARNVISGNGYGVLIDNADDNLVTGNYIGTNALGTGDLGNASGGVAIFNGAGNTVGGAGAGAGNVIAGNLRGVEIYNPTATDNVIQGNIIGLDVAGNAGFGNTQHGVSVAIGSNGTQIGGTVPAARNVISGNGGDGISLGSNGNTVEGNYVGTSLGGTGDRGNGGHGVRFTGEYSWIGHPTGPEGRNVISGNGGDGVHIVGPTTSGATVASNYIGVSATGAAAIANDGNGVTIRDGVWNAGIGRPSSADPGVAPGNVISGNGGSGVLISGPDTRQIDVESNLIGTNAAGTGALPNGFDGVTLQRGVEDTRIGVGNIHRNVISGNDLSGVFMVDPGTTGNVIGANHIGLNKAGTAAIPNGNGVEFSNGAQANRIGDPTFGAEPTIISGNRLEGVYVHGSATDHNLITRSRIGLRPGGLSALPNDTGVLISGGAQLNTVGGAAAADGNTISGNRTSGVLITGAQTDRNVVRGNFIGTTVDGGAAVPNDIGVNVTAGARSNTIGGTLLAPKSLISGNTTAGVRVSDASTLGNRLYGNLIGTGAGGAGPRPNGTGVIVTNGARATQVGGASTTLGNWIAFNTGSGVLVDGAATTGAEIARNRIFDNGQLGINLRPAGEPPNTVTPNDPDDPDTGPNALQNFPVITVASGAGSTTTVSGTLNSGPSASYRVEVFRNPAGSGSGAEGATFAAADTTVATNASGDATWSVSIPGDHSGQVLRATATRLDSRNTSEFSGVRVVD